MTGVRYPYASADLLATPNTYFFSAYEGQGFRAAGRPVVRNAPLVGRAA
ncbi:MAG: hypothetical protein R3E83_11375 [Burkholderiaceae bacterium]